MGYQQKAQQALSQLSDVGSQALDTLMKFGSNEERSRLIQDMHTGGGFAARDLQTEAKNSDGTVKLNSDGTPELENLTFHTLPRPDSGKEFVKPKSVEPTLQELPNGMRVRIIAHPTAPVLMSGMPQQSDLYEILEVFDAVSPKDTEQSFAAPCVYDVFGQHGTIEQPKVRSELEPGCLFIDDKPSSTDIWQGGMGDCYFMAALGSVAATEPGHICNMVETFAAESLEDSKYKVRFHAYNASFNTWCPVYITVDAKFINSSSIKAANFVVDSEPEMSEWHSSASEYDYAHSLSVHRKDLFQAALWVPILEKAYALFAEIYGQNGGYKKDKEKAGDSGYDRIDNGGYASFMWSIIYGNRASIIALTEPLNMSHNSSENCILENEQMVYNLLAVSQNAPEKGEQKVMMEVFLTEVKAIERLAVYLDLVLEQESRDPSSESEKKKFLLALRLLQTDVDMWLPLKKLLNSPVEEEKRHQVARQAGRLIEQSKLSSGDYPELNEFAHIVANMGVDSGKSKRFIYASHSYAVQNALFIDAAGIVLDLSSQSGTSDIEKIDAEKSLVQLQNPHHGDEPNLKDSMPDGKEEGMFFMTLAQFLRSFSHFHSATIPSSARN